MSLNLVGAQLHALSPSLPPSDHLRYRIGAVIPSHPARGLAQALSTAVPSTFWPRLTLQLGVPDIGYTTTRSALVVALLLVGTRITVAEAVTQLGSVVTPAGTSRVLALLRRSTRWRTILSALTYLADALDETAPPIDYDRRRALSVTGLLPSEVWREICLAVGVPQGRALRHRLARCWLFERLTGLPATRSPWAISSCEFRSKLADFPLLLTTSLVVELDDYVRKFLSSNGIDEPVTWSPPTSITENLELPPAVPEALHLEDIHEHVTTASPRSFASLVERFQVGIDVLRYVLQDKPREPPKPEQNASGRNALGRAAHRVPRSLFEDLYVQQRLSLAEIGQYAGVSRQTITRLAASYGIAVRPAHRPTAQRQR